MAKIALIADAYPPLRTSAAVQLQHLSIEFARQGHFVTVIVPNPDQREQWRVDHTGAVRVLRLRSWQTKGVRLFRRLFAEMLMPFAMIYGYQRSSISRERWDAVVWYSPSIFHGPFIRMLKKSSGCKGYLILRDIFPQWALDTGVIRPGLPFSFLAAVARYQYTLADTIGVQSAGSKVFFQKFAADSRQTGHVEVLNNWLGCSRRAKCSIDLKATAIAGRKVLVYAGNMGAAQGMDILIALCERFAHRRDVGFLFVGRGDRLDRLVAIASARNLSNLVFRDEVEPEEVADLLSQCVAGLIALDARHRTHNIPGKFLSYMQEGLPVLAAVNAGNDVAALIRNSEVGEVLEGDDINEFFECALRLLDKIDSGFDFGARCRKLFEAEFMVEQAVAQITDAIS